MFAAEIHAGSDISRVDWRSDYDALTYDVCEVADDVRAGVLGSAVEMWAVDGAWARSEDGSVRQAGPRLLWDAVEAAHTLYVENGRPGRERFGVTVTAQVQRIWLDAPSRSVPRGQS
ncbi:hypothetical protein [Streptomyces sp. NBC_00280]|uniref:hypothetical protein n=1 Tax=Streptomyces sp. NBC_00280 TaxID=2975699 RepID=UPI00352EBD90